VLNSNVYVPLEAADRNVVRVTVSALDGRLFQTRFLSFYVDIRVNCENVFAFDLHVRI